MTPSYTIKDGIKTYLDFIYVTLLWFVASFLGILLSLGSATLALYKVLASLSNIKKQTYILSTFFDEFKHQVFKRMLISLLFIIDIFGLIIAFQYAIQNNRLWLIVLLCIISYEIIIGVIYTLGVFTLFEIKKDQSYITVIFILMHQNLWRNIQLLAPIIILIFGFFYVHPTTIFFTISMCIWLQLVILKRSLIKILP